MGWDGRGGCGGMGSFSGCLYMGYRVRGHEGGLVVVEYAVARAVREIKGFEGLKMEGLGLCGSDLLG